ncbi:TIGR02099 family protein [Pseudidiomarina planktonica]|uniref:TIGR02099 family protein n=1 Tax=Pseudidiomarina planktonica TaxID=1323738 RepID=A0A1Y6ECW8_9GAMM|nr:YhdP family protein [Pseudidiomarina planktonica]RUO66107.1 TIGR02099 family protein [Pseudidiomarina planktonica]SMQ60404.1 TIGR02099 family protein [Pseudidiomarina planktonica]
MSVTRVASFIIRKLWLSIAILLVLAAVLLTVLRLSLPYLPNVTEPVEQWLASNYQLDVEVTELSADWGSSGPRLVLRGVQVHSDSGSAVDIKIGSMFVALDFWTSLREWRPTAAAFLIADADIRYDSNLVPAGSETDTVTDVLADLFLQQLERFSLRSSQLHLRTGNEPGRTLLIDELSWRNQGSRHQGTGQFRISEFTNNRLDFIVDLQGQDVSELAGQLYVSASEFDVSPWLQQRMSEGEITNAELNFTGWLNFGEGQLQEGTLRFRNNQLAWQNQNESYQLELQQGLVKLEQTAAGWLINSTPMTMLSSYADTQEWELPALQWQYSDGQHQASMSNLPLQHIVPLAGLIGMPDSSDYFTAMQVEGYADVGLTYAVEPGLEWLLKASQIGWQGHQKLPTVRDVTVNAYGTLNSADAEITGQQVQIQSDVLADTSWQVDELALQLQWQQHSQGFALNLANTSKVQIADMKLAPSFHWYQLANQAAQIELQLAANETFEVQTLRDHLPAVLGDNLKRYLNESVRAGQVADLLLIWRGEPGAFPYHETEGVFQAHAWLEALDFKFQPNWPALSNMNALLSVVGDDLSIQSSQGDIAGMQVQSATAVIENMQAGDPVLAIDAEVEGDAVGAAPLFNASPLADSVGTALAAVELQDQINGAFQLIVPLNESAATDAVVTGYVEFVDNRVRVTAVDQAFTKLNGRLRFANEVLAADNLSLQWHGLPLQVNVAGEQPTDQPYAVDIAVTADWQTDTLFDHLPEAPMQEYAYGAVNWRADLVVTLPADGNYTYQWQQRTDLTGLEMTSPAPFSKEFGEPWHWLLNVSGNADQLQLTSRLLAARDENREDILAEGEVTVGTADRRLEHGYINIGQTQDMRVLPNPSQFIVSANLSQADIGHWFSFISQLSGNGEEAGENNLRNSYMPDLIQVNSPALTWAGQRFDDASIQAFPNENGWQIELNANQTAMEIRLPRQLTEERIEVNARFLELADVATLRETVATTPDIDLTDFPAISLICERCQYGDHNLGRISAEFAPIEDGIAIENVLVNRGSNRLQLEGRWLRKPAADGELVDQTFLNGSLSSDDFGALLSEYDITTVIQDSSASINADLSWQGSPYEWNADSLDGRLEWTLGQGYLRDVNEGGARLLSILSLEGLLRKLTLDFRDVFSNGMFYTRFGGTLAIDDGVASTSDTRLLGSAGDLEVQGTTNLVNDEVDYRLVYVPKVTSSLPVILAWMINPPSGLAALLIDRMLFDAQVISRLEYRVTGTINDPVVDEVLRDSRKVELPKPEAEQENPQQQPEGESP